jgi:hypothetical protein
MVAYWRLNEDRKTQTEYKDSVDTSMRYDPLTHPLTPKPFKDV